MSRRAARRCASLLACACAAWVASSVALRVAAFCGGAPLIPRPSAAARRALQPLTSEQLENIKAWEVQEEVLSEEAAAQQVEAAAFSIPADELILRAKYYLSANQDGVSDASLLADDFEFVGPFIGPLDKQEFIKQLKSFNYRAAFPDSAVQWHHFRVDPFDASRVWFSHRGHGTNLGAVPGIIPEPTGKEFISPPQTCSLRFNEKGEVREYTAGYIMDRRQGNQGGLGGLFGVLYGIGKPLPFPEAQPYEMSWQRRLIMWVASLSS